MSTLIKCELIKLRHSLSIGMLFLLALLPIVINMARPLLIKQQYQLFDLYFPLYNQYALFFPLVVMMVATAVFYMEYSNGTYVDWITYGYSKQKLIISKLTVAGLVLLAMCLLNYFIMALGLLLMVHATIVEVLQMTASFWGYSLTVILLNLPFGALLINISRNAIITTVVGIVCMVINAILMAAPFGYYIPTIFAYRFGLLPISRSDFFSNANFAASVGSTITIVVICCLVTLSIWQFSRKKPIEN